MPASHWTMAKKGSKQIPITGLEDKREMTVLLAVSSNGDVLPPQLIYQGRSDRCHPAGVKFPSDWHITHSNNHWANEETMLQYIEKVIGPYMDSCRESLGRPDQKGLCIYDAFAAHRCDSVRQKLLEHGLLHVEVPPGCTGELQPLDVTVNRVFKKYMSDMFELWYSDLVASDTEEELQMSKAQFPLTQMKPLHAGWLMASFSKLKQRRALIMKGFTLSGLSAAQSEVDYEGYPSDASSTDESDASSTDDSDDGSEASSCSGDTIAMSDSETE